MKAPTIKRTCGDCTECCKGWLSANIYGREMYEGRPCHFLGANKCSIYVDRPNDPCKAFKCEWLADDGTIYPEWLRPDMAKVIVSGRHDPDTGNQFLEAKECGETIDSKVLNWLYLFAAQYNVEMRIQVAGIWNKIDKR